MSQWFVKFGIKEKEYKNGLENIHECLENIVENSNCSKKCIPLIYNFLTKYPKCDNENDYYCNNGQIYDGNQRFECLRPKSLIQYKGEPIISKIDSRKHTYLRLILQFPNSLVEVNEEIFVISDLDYLASVGGSLGLFLGFSFFGCFSTFFDLLCTKIINSKKIKPITPLGN